MRSNETLWGRLATFSLSLATAGLAASCNQLAEPPPRDVPSAAVTQQALTVDELAKSCGLDVNCTGPGIAEGNASISGVGKVDAFFQSVLDFQTKSTSISSAIDAELQAIRGDFGIEADVNLADELGAMIDAQLEGGLEIDAEPARCAVDAQASLQAQAKCDVEVEPGKATVECKGSCAVEAGAEVECDAEADLRCTMAAPSIDCKGECKGSCEVALQAAARCDGTCKGSCSGKCSAYVKNADGELECEGACEGSCEGSCKTELAAEAACMGTCEGECTVQNPEAGCEGGIRAECKAKADASISCNGRCEGEFEPPAASAECEVSARAQAKLNVECTPPRVAIRYALKVNAVRNALGARPSFIVAVEKLKVRLPALLAAIKRAESVHAAGTELSVDGRAAMRAAVMTALSGDASIQVKVGLTCAATQLDTVGDVLESSVGKIKDSIDASVKLTAALQGQAR
jgi:hypothetical protein